MLLPHTKIFDLPGPKNIVPQLNPPPPEGVGRAAPTLLHPSENRIQLGLPLEPPRYCLLACCSSHPHPDAHAGVTRDTP